MSDSKFTAEDAYELTTRCAPDKDALTDAEEKELRQVLEHIARTAACGYTSCLATIHSDNVTHNLRDRGFDANYNATSGRYVIAWGKGHAAD